MAEQIAPPSIPYGPPISYATAKTAMAAAEAEAVKNHWGVAIAIVDSGDNLVLLRRLDNTQLSAVRIAEAKATSALRAAPRIRTRRWRRPAPTPSSDRAMRLRSWTGA